MHEDMNWHILTFSSFTTCLEKYLRIKQNKSDVFHRFDEPDFTECFVSLSEEIRSTQWHRHVYSMQSVKPRRENRWRFDCRSFRKTRHRLSHCWWCRQFDALQRSVLAEQSEIDRPCRLLLLFSRRWSSCGDLRSFPRCETRCDRRGHSFYDPLAAKAHHLRYSYSTSIRSIGHWNERFERHGSFALLRRIV